MKYTYDQLVEFWGNCSAETKELEPGLKVSRSSNGSFILRWFLGNRCTALAFIDQDGRFSCWRTEYTTESTLQDLAKFFDFSPGYVVRYPEVLGIKGYLEDVHSLQLGPTDHIQPREICKAPFTYEQLTAAVAYQILHYCRLHKRRPPTKVKALKKIGGELIVSVGRFRKLAQIIKAVLVDAGLSSSLKVGESITWVLPNLEPIESDLVSLAGKLGRPSTKYIAYRHTQDQVQLDARAAAACNLSALDFSRFPHCFPKRAGSLETKVSGDRVQIFHRATKALLAEVERDKTLTFWDIDSSFAQKVHSVLSPKLRTIRCYDVCTPVSNRYVPYAQVPNLTLYGPIFDGWRMNVEGICTNPLKVLDLPLDEAAQQLRRIISDWYIERLMPGGVANLETSGRVLNLLLEAELSADGVRVIIAPLWTSMNLVIEALWCWKTKQSWVSGRKLIIEFSGKVASAHDLLSLMS